MGWSWAFWIAQAAHAYQAMIGSGLAADRFIDHETPACKFDNGEPMILTCCDNLNIAGTDKQAVDQCLYKVVAHLRSVGLPVHKILPASTSAKSSGYVLDGGSVLGNVRPDPARLRLLLKTAPWLSRRPRVTTGAV